MKVRALTRLSGPMGVKETGDEFVVDAAQGADLIERKAVEEVATKAEPASETSLKKEKA